MSLSRVWSATNLSYRTISKYTPSIPQRKKTHMPTPIQYQVGVGRIAAVGTGTGGRSPHFLGPLVFVDGFHFIFG